MQRKSFIILLLLAGTLASDAQQKKNSIVITGEITGLEDKVIYLSTFVADTVQTDSLKVKDGKFSWKGVLKEPQRAFLKTNKSYTDLFLSNTNVHIQGNINSPEKLRVTGSPLQDEHNAYKASIRDITDKQQQLEEQYEVVAGNDSTQTAWEGQLRQLDEEVEDRAVNYIRSHPGSFVSLCLLSDMAYMRGRAPLDSLYGQLASASQQTETGKQLAKRLEILRRTAIGQPIMDFTQADTSGQLVKISNLRGKYVLLDFWASWCGPCRAENPNVLKAYLSHKEKNFIVLAVSLDSKAGKWKSAIREDGMPWLQVSDLKGWRNVVAQQYGINSIPSNFLIDPQGIIIAKDLRGPALQKKLNEVLH